MFSSVGGLLAHNVPASPPKTWNYRPTGDVRSPHGFVGLRNLGATCYMNSVLQQLFMTESFRYSLLAANDRKLPEMSMEDGREFDDNTFHQLQKMFAFL